MKRYSCCSGYEGHDHDSNCRNYEAKCPEWITDHGYRHDLYMQDLAGKKVFLLPHYEEVVIDYVWLGRDNWPTAFAFRNGQQAALHRIVESPPSYNIPRPTAEQMYEMLRYSET